jgi:hypothetical protein
VIEACGHALSQRLTDKENVYNLILLLYNISKESRYLENIAKEAAGFAVQRTLEQRDKPEIVHFIAKLLYNLSLNTISAQEIGTNATGQICQHIIRK